MFSYGCVMDRIIPSRHKNSKNTQDTAILSIFFVSNTAFCGMRFLRERKKNEKDTFFYRIFAATNH